MKKNRRNLVTLSLNPMLTKLAKIGCTPAIYYRGRGLWRAHVNASGNFWHNGRSPMSALIGAIRLWRKRGYLLDGTAHRPTTSHGESCAVANTEEVW